MNEIDEAIMDNLVALAERHWDEFMAMNAKDGLHDETIELAFDQYARSRRWPFKTYDDFLAKNKPRQKEGE